MEPQPVRAANSIMRVRVSCAGEGEAGTPCASCSAKTNVLQLHAERQQTAQSVEE